MKNRTFGDSFKNALDGIVYVIKAERNMKIHIAAALVVILLSINYKLDKIETVFVCIAIGLVLICELLNTAIEVLVDMVMESFHPKAKIVKDVAAGGVLMSAILSVVIGYIIFIDRVAGDTVKAIGFLRNLDMRISIAILTGAIVFMVIIAAAFKKKVSIKSSWDTIIAFIISASAMAVLLWNVNVKNSILFFGICMLVVISRFKKKMQNVYEILLGAVPAFLIVLIIYQAVCGKK